MPQRDTDVAQRKRQLNTWHATMTDLEAQARGTRIEARDKDHVEMTRRALKSKKAGPKLDQMMAAGEFPWEAMVAEMEKVRDALTRSFNCFRLQR